MFSLPTFVLWYTLDYGCLVCWNFDDNKEEMQMLQRLEPFQGSTSYDAETQQDFLEEFTFLPDDPSGIFNVDNDEFILEGQDILEKLSISFAMGQAVQLQDI